MKKIISILTFLILSSNSSFSKEINIDTFFNKFNMRSTLSSMGPQLRYWCGSYPSEFFEIKEEKDKRVILVRDKDQFWDVSFLDNNKVVIYDRITNGTYSTEEVVQLIYVDEKEEWWDELSVKGGELTNPETSGCKKQ
tara:strand:+ start:49 stop:462 length:414 start_codon:yes stop_codon:yes gene_type:complete